jgi:hypothetical protein
VYSYYDAGRGGHGPSVTGRPGPAAWWYLIPIGIFLLGLVTSGAIALAPTGSSRPAAPIAEGQLISFDMKSG